MKAVLLRVGIDTGAGGIHAPLFSDHTFEYIPIPDYSGIDARTYGNTKGRHGRRLIEYFPPAKHNKHCNQPIHFDPEFETFTYGDPTSLKSGLRRLEKGDYLIFYCGLEGYDFEAEPALYIIGYFEVDVAGRANDFRGSQLRPLFGANFHVRHQDILNNQRSRLVLVKGTQNSLLLSKACKISEYGKDRNGKPLKVISREMQAIFGDFGGKISIQRSSPRWISPAYIDKAVMFVKSLA
jgi:hypothetical protein